MELKVPRPRYKDGLISRKLALKKAAKEFFNIDADEGTTDTIFHLIPVQVHSGTIN